MISPPPARIREALGHLARAVVPVQCPGCGMADLPCCEACAALWWEPPFRCEAGAGRLDVPGRAPTPVWAVQPLEGAAHRMVAAWKDGGRRDLDPFFGGALARAARRLAPVLAPLAPLSVVPLPCRPRSLRRRGVDLPMLLARATAAALADRGTAAVPAPALRLGGGDSRGQGARQRWRSARRSLTLRPGARGSVGRGVGRAVLLVDDVLTTGASLAVAAQALERVGAAVAGGLVLAATPRRDPG